MNTKMTLITPAMAEKWLKESNTSNRPLRKGLVRHYAEMMRRGDWEKHHQGIAFNCDGTLLDGQHRLAAIIESGCCIWMNVSEGVPQSAQIFIDDHAKRTPHDAIAIAGGFSINQKHVAIARSMMSRGSNNGDFSKKDVLEYWRKFGDRIVFAASLFPTNIKRISVAPVLAVIARASWTLPEDRLRHFAEVLRTLEMKSVDDVAAVTIARWLLSTNGSGWYIYRAMYMKTERALQAFIQRDKKFKKATSIERELFPLPGEFVQGSDEEDE